MNRDLRIQHRAGAALSALAPLLAILLALPTASHGAPSPRTTAGSAVAASANSAYSAAATAAPATAALATAALATAATAATATAATPADSARHPAPGLPASQASIADTSRPAPSPSPNPAPPTRTARVSSAAPDAFVCALVGIIPLSSGYYLTSAPTKGIAFSLADAVLIGSIWNIRRDDNIPDRDVTPYFFLLGAVNALDAVLSGLQARNDAVRIRTTLTPSGEPTVGLAWTF